MAKSPSVGRRILLAGGLSIAMAAAPAAAFVMSSHAPAGSAVACPAGEVEDIYIGECVPEMAPNTPGGNYPTPSGTGITNSTPGDAEQRSRGPGHSVHRRQHRTVHRTAGGPGPRGRAALEHFVQPLETEGQ